LLLVVPATSATAERSFSALRWLKIYLRATMGQARLNSLLILHWPPGQSRQSEPKGHFPSIFLCI